MAAKKAEIVAKKVMKEASKADEADCWREQAAQFYVGQRRIQSFQEAFAMSQGDHGSRHRWQSREG